MSLTKFFQFVSRSETHAAAFLAVVCFVIWQTSNRFPLFIVSVLVLLSWLQADAAPDSAAKLHERALYLLICSGCAGVCVVAFALALLVRFEHGLLSGFEWTLVTIGLGLAFRIGAQVIKSARDAVEKREGYSRAARRLARVVGLHLRGRATIPSR